jgi:hypothetical protein
MPAGKRPKNRGPSKHDDVTVPLAGRNAESLSVNEQSWRLACVLSRQFEFTINPQDTCPMAAVLDRVGAIKTRPTSWKIIFPGLQPV